MNRLFHGAVLAGIAMLAVSCGEPTAPAELSQVDAAIVGANEGVIPIDACGTVISAPGKYRLTTDLINCSDAEAGWAIAIRASDVILRLDGHRIASNAVGAVETCIQATGDRIRIVGPGVIGYCLYGLMLEGVANSSVSNLQVQADQGIVLNGVSGITLEHLSIVDHVEYALYQSGPVSDLVLRHSVIRRTVMHDADGFFLSGTRITIEHNVFDQLGYSVALTGDDNRVADNRISNTFLGIWVRGAGNSVLRNDVTGVSSLGEEEGVIRTGLGISVDGTANQILRNVVSGVAVEGISVSGSGNLISGNRLFGNTGIDLVDLNGVCGVNIWEKNRADTRSPACLE